MCLFLSSATDLRDKLEVNTKYFRHELSRHDFNILPGGHPIIPLMLGEAALAARFAEVLLTKGVYAIAFSHPVVPPGKARLRLQISAAHTREDLEFVLTKLKEARQELGL